MNDTTLLTLLARDKNTHDRFAPLVKEYVLSKECYDIFKAIGEYYKSYPSATKVDWAEFSTFFFLVRKLNTEKATTYRLILDNIHERSRSLELLKPEELPKFHQDVYKHFVKLDYLTQITNLSLKTGQDLVSGREVEFDAISDLVDKCKSEVGRSEAPDSIFVPRNLSAIVSTVSAPGLEWPLEELNVSLGPLRKGDFIVVGAYVETGKTTFAAHCVSHMVRHLEAEAGPILWINNEEQSAKVMFRIIQSYFGVTTEELLKNSTKYESLFTSEVGDRILVPADDSGYNSVGRLNALFREYKPSLIVFDQLDKVHLHGEFARDDIRLGNLYKWARDKSKTHCPIIAITQVDASGATSQYITAAQLRGSKVDKPAEADAIITIGRSSDMAKASSRFIHFPKNKLLGGDRCREEFRHGYHEVQIKPEIARYVGSMKREARK
jgi:KaiC/GvpD/RAD55 family RecA-like ATPase